MTLIEPGRICVIIRGADAGKKVIIQEILDNTFVKIVGEKVKERRINIKHLEPTPKKTEILPEKKKIKKLKKAEEKGE